MAGPGTVFPAYLKLENDGSNEAFASLQGAIDRLFTGASSRAQRFNQEMGQVRDVLRNALAGTDSLGAGRVDLNVDQYRQAAAQANLAYQALNEVLTTSRELAAQTGDTSAQTRAWNQALAASTIEAQKHARETELQVLTYERLQAALDKTASSSNAVAQAFASANPTVGNTGLSVAQIDELREAEADSAAAARQLEASQRFAATQINLTGKSARESAQVFESYARAVNELRSQIDPAAFALQRYTQQVELLDSALAAGDIKLTEHQRLLALTRAEYERNSTSTRAQRFAYVQLGQQLQDVAIQAQLGVNPLIILTQQGSQAAYAMTGLGGTAGKFATFMAGPWGAAILGGVTALGLLYGSMQETEKASKSLGDGIDFQRKSVNELISAIEELERAQAKQIRSSYESEQAALADANAALSAAKAKREQAIATLEQVKAGAKYNLSLGLTTPGGVDAQLAGGLIDESLLNSEIAKLKAAQDTNARLVREASIPIVKRQAEAASDPRKGIEFKYEQQSDLLKQMYVASAISLDAYSASLGKLTAARERDLDALKKHSDTSGKAAREAARIAEAGEDAAKKIANITDRFSDIPPQVAAVNRAMRELDDLADDFAKNRALSGIPAAEQAKIEQQIAAARAVLEEAKLKPLKDFNEEAQKQADIDKLILAGKTDQAAALRILLDLQSRMKPITEAQLAGELKIIQAGNERAKQLAVQARAQQAYLTAINGTRAAISNSIAGALTGRGGDLIGSLKDQLANLFATRLTDKLFDPLFDKLTDQVTGGGQNVEKSLIELANVIRKYARDIGNASDTINGVSGGEGNDRLRSGSGSDRISSPDPNDPEAIVVTGTRLAGLSIPGQNDPIVRLTEKLALKFENFLGGLGKLLKENAEGGGIGLLASSAILGSSSSGVGSFLGGAIGDKIGSKLGDKLGKTLGSFSEALGPIGAIAGGLLGGLFDGLFAPPPPSGRGSVNESGVNVVANRDEVTASLTGFGTNLQAAINSLVRQFDAKKGSYDVGIGQYEDYFQVASTSIDPFLGKAFYKDLSTLDLYDGKDQAEAMRAAILNAIQDGAIRGIREGTQRLLVASKDLDDNLQKALSFEQFFKDYKATFDPVGAAIDEINIKYSGLKDVFKAAGASAQEFADLEKLYGRQRADAIEQATARVTGSLKGFLDQLTTGNSSLSLRERIQSAQAAFDPLAARVRAGDATAYDDYTQQSQALLELMRAAYGSGEQYFNVLDDITALTRQALDVENGRIATASAAGSPFDTAPIVTATETQTKTLVDALGSKLDDIAKINRTLASLMRDGAVSNQEDLGRYLIAIGAAGNF